MKKGNRVIDGLKRISKPGLRDMLQKEELPKVLNGLGIAIISTSKGLKTDKEAKIRCRWRSFSLRMVIKDFKLTNLILACKVTITIDGQKLL